MADATGRPTTAVALVALFIYLIAVIYLALNRAEAEPQWSRMIYVFGGVEAIAFAAAGYFFGKEVNRQRADKAEEKADKAEGQARGDSEKKTEAVVNLAALRHYIDTQAPIGSSANEAVLAELRSLAEVPGLGSHPSLTARIGEKSRSALAVDPHWEKLRHFARSL